MIVIGLSACSPDQIENLLSSILTDFTMAIFWGFKIVSNAGRAVIESR